MFRRSLSVALSVLLVGAVGARPAFGGAGQGGRPADAAKVKAAVARLGVGKSARVGVRLLDRTKVKGYVKVAPEEDFIVANEEDGTEVAVPYSQVKNVTGDTRSTGKKVAVAAAGIVGVISLVGLLLWGASRS